MRNSRIGRINLFSLLAFLLATSSAMAWQSTGKLAVDRSELLRQCTTAVVAISNENADSSDTSRLFELVMAAEVNGMTVTADRLKRALLIYQPESVQASYLLLKMQNAGEMNSLMREEFKSRTQNLDHDFCRNYCLAMKVGLKKFGPALLGEDILLQTTLAADIARDLSLMVQCREQLQNSDTDDLRSIEKIAFSRTLSAQERFIQLQPFHDNEAVRIIQSQFYRILDDSQKQNPRVRAILAQNSLLDNENEVALSLIEGLVGEHESDNLMPKLMYWKAMALTRLSRPDEAIVSLEKQIKEYPNSEWTAAAIVVLDALSHHEVVVEERVEMLGKLVEKILSTNCERIELQLIAESEPDSATTRSCLFSLDISESIFQFQLMRNGDPSLVFHSDDEATRLYVGGDEQITQAAKPVYPCVQLNLKESESGGFTMGMNFNVSTDVRAAKVSLLSFLSSPIVSTEAGRRRLMMYDLNRGKLFPASVKVDGKTKLITLTPKISEPGFDRSEIWIDAEDKLARLTFGSFTLDQIRYGSSKDFELSSLAFPDCRTVHTKSFDMNIFAKLLGSVFEFFGDEQPSPSQGTADEKTQTAKQSDSNDFKPSSAKPLR